MKIAFYHHNSTFPKVDCRHLEKGNPGIGGSEYALLTVAKKLHGYSEKLDVTVFAEVVDEMLPKMSYRKVQDLMEAISISEKEGISVMVFRYGIDVRFNAFLKHQRTNLKLVLWCHNFVSCEDLDLYAKSDAISRLICVGREQLDLYRDHPAFLKSDYIYNAIPQELFDSIKKESIPSFEERGKVVTYIGSLVPAKGFHLLAKAWPEVIKKVPNASLNIIGSGKLYDRGARLGRFGIAEESYENSFIEYLTKDGMLLPSVRFLGILGSEKNEVLKATKVGVPNPSGRTETYGFTAVEMQMMGAIVTTRRCAGYLDTVFTNAILYRTPRMLVSSIVRQLQEKDNNYIEMFKQLESTFSLDIVIKDWLNLLENAIWNGQPLHDKRVKANFFFHCKWLKELLRQFKRTIPHGYILIPALCQIRFYLTKIKRRICD